MMGMELDVPLSAPDPETFRRGNSWAEVIDPGAIQQATQGYGADYGQRMLVFDVDGLNLKQAVSYIVGYSECLSISTGQPFNPSLSQSQGPYKLSRSTPARHPDMPNLRATKIVSIQGRGLRNRDTPGTAAGGAQDSGGVGVYGQWQRLRFAVLFEIPKYQILEDATLAGRPEYMRYTEWIPDVNLETQSRKGQTWYACWTGTPAAPSPVTQTTFPGDRLLRIPKGVLKMIWYDVHIDYVMLGRLSMSNYVHRVGTVNSRPFPQKAYLDQNANPTINVTNPFDATSPAHPPYVQYPAGTCLMMPPKVPTPHGQCHPAVLADPLLLDYFPRTVDVETNILIFDPPCNDPTVINLTGLDRWGNPLNGSLTTPIRGHQLAPLVQPYQDAGGQWWQWIAWSTGSNLPSLITNRSTGTPPGLGYVLNAQMNTLILLLQAGAPQSQIQAAGLATWQSQSIGGNITTGPPAVIQAVRNQIAKAVGGPPQSDYDLLYPYSDFEACWSKSPESL